MSAQRSASRLSSTMPGRRDTESENGDWLRDVRSRGPLERRPGGACPRFRTAVAVRPSKRGQAPSEHAEIRLQRSRVALGASPFFDSTWRCRTKTPRRNNLVNLAIKIGNSKYETNSKHEGQKNIKLRRFWTFEIRNFDLFRISCFGFRNSDVVKRVHLFLRGP